MPMRLSTRFVRVFRRAGRIQERSALRRIVVRRFEWRLPWRIRGMNNDANKFTAETIGRGPAAILVSKELAAEVVALAQAKEVALILVDDTIATLNRLAGAYRAGMGDVSGMRARVIAVGGSN